MSAVAPETAVPDVAVVGFGYIGSVIAAVLAARGLSVVGIDTNAEMIAALNQGKCPIPEPDLEDLVAAGVKAGKLSGSTDPAAAKGVKAILITVGTPLSDEFCGTCNRVRVTARGDVRACLASRRATSLRDVMREGGDDRALAHAIIWSLGGKADGHFFLDPDVHEHDNVGMSLIGG